MADEFGDLLFDALLDPERADYTALREAFTRADAGEFLVHDEEAHEELCLRMIIRRWDDAAQLAEEILERDPLCIRTRLTLARAFEAMGEDREAGEHRAFASGLIRAILRSGDGSSPESAFRVVHTREQYVVLEILGLAAQRSHLAQVDGVWLDNVEVEGPDGRRVVYFRVDLPQGWVSLRPPLSGG